MVASGIVQFAVGEASVEEIDRFKHPAGDLHGDAAARCRR